MDYEVIISLLTLIGLEVVLGIDNIIFISILAGKLPPQQQKSKALGYFSGTPKFLFKIFLSQQYLFAYR